MKISTLLVAAVSALCVGAAPIADSFSEPEPRSSAPLYFPVEQATLHNARRLDKYEARINGLVLGQDSPKVTFEKTGGDDWIQINTDGSISGKPGPHAPERSHAEVRATSENGATASLSVTIPVRTRGQRLVDDLRVMSYNLWHGGSQVNNHHEKQLRFILESGADIIGLQEASGADPSLRLSEALGWYHWRHSVSSVATISRYPIVEELGETSRAGGVRISLEPQRKETDVIIWNVHLGYTPYGPYDFCYDKMTPEQVLEREIQSGRTPQVTDLMTRIKPYLSNSKKVPVIVVGDFNAPSHLDWTEALREKNCGIADFPWPTSVLPAENGLIDSFRIANPDPVKVPGITWSPIFPFNGGSTGPPEPQDRIDYVYHTKQRLTVVDSQALVVGNPKPSPNHKDNEWTSDHAAVLTHYRVD